MFKIFALFFSFLLTFEVLVAQNNEFDGFFLNLSGDTTNTYFIVKKNEINTLNISKSYFTLKGKTGDIQKISPDTITYLSINLDGKTIKYSNFKTKKTNKFIRVLKEGNVNIMIEEYIHCRLPVIYSSSRKTKRLCIWSKKLKKYYISRNNETPRLITKKNFKELINEYFANNTEIIKGVENKELKYSNIDAIANDNNVR